jgi:bla regulator protein BlaR1
MQQSLLANRFNLKVHFETRELSIYALIVAKGGPKMSPTEMNPANPSETLKPRSLRMTGKGVATGTGVTTAMLAELLERQAELGSGSGRTVVDKTNLSGLYDWTLHWTPWHDLPGEAPPDSSGPSLFTALKDQLGAQTGINESSGGSNRD